MILSGCLQRCVLARHAVLSSSALKCVMKVPSYRLSASGSLLRMDAIVTRKAPSTPHVWAKTLYTGRAQLNQKREKEKEFTFLQQGAEPTSFETVTKLGVKITIIVLISTVVIFFVLNLYDILKGQFLPSSPTKLYKTALEKCQNHCEVTAFFGEPVNPFEILNLQEKRQYVRAVEYMKRDVPHIRMTFSISGQNVSKGAVTADYKENSQTGKYDVHFIIVEIATDPKTSIIVEDNQDGI